MDYIRGAPRNQVILFPESVEDYITGDNPVRFIDAFVASPPRGIANLVATQDSALSKRVGRPNEKQLNINQIGKPPRVRRQCSS